MSSMFISFLVEHDYFIKYLMGLFLSLTAMELWSFYRQHRAARRRNAKIQVIAALALAEYQKEELL